MNAEPNNPPEAGGTRPKGDFIMKNYNFVSKKKNPLHDTEEYKEFEKAAEKRDKLERDIHCAKILLKNHIKKLPDLKDLLPRLEEQYEKAKADALKKFNIYREMEDDYVQSA